MGCFGGGGKTPELQSVPAPQVKSAADIMSESSGFAKSNYPLAYGAREGALADLARGNDYYNTFQPTSFEQALGSQYFKNVMPDITRGISHNLSLSGMESSPVLAEQIGKAQGGLETDIGKYLSDLGNQRAINSLQTRLGIDPYNVSGPYANVDTSQSNLQSEYEYNAALQKAQTDYQNALAKAKQKAEQTKLISTIGFGALGALTGGLGWLGAGAGGIIPGFTAAQGAMLGGGLGSNISGLFGGGGEGGINFSDALAAANYSPSGTTQRVASGMTGVGNLTWDQLLRSVYAKN